MNELEKHLAQYLEPILGRPLELREVAPELTRKLPLFLRRRYSLRVARLFGQDAHLALDANGGEPSTPTEYAAQVESLRTQLGVPVVLVLPALSASVRNRMVQAMVPFIVPGSQLFLPPNAVELRERYPVRRRPAVAHLTPATQCILLYHLQKERLEGLPLTAIAERLRYSTMKLSQAKHELEGAGLAELERHGKTICLSFPMSARALWDKALPVLSTPLQKSLWVRCPQVPPNARVAGISGLSVRTILADDPVPTYAMSRPAFRRGLESGEFREAHDAADADARLEVWTYDPLLLAGERVVDSLSMFLSLEHADDERVKQSLDDLLAKVTWT